MKKNMKFIASALCALIAAAGCNDADKMEYGKEVLAMTGTDRQTLVTFAVDDEDPLSYTYPVTVSATNKVTKRTTIDLKIDNSLVEKYNTQNNTTYFALPDAAAVLEQSQVVIEEGKASSSIANLTITNPSAMEPGRLYIIPVTMIGTDGNMDILESSRTIYLRVSQTIGFTALNIANSGGNTAYSNFIFDDSKAVDLTDGFTYEIKCYISDFRGNRTGTICRLCSWTSKDESGSVMLRFNENGTDPGTLQAVNPVGNIVSNTKFEEGRWYTISITYDGSALRMFVDGVRDVETTGSPSDPVVFQRFEMGMSWGGYYSSQEFRGRISEIRVWNRALTAGQIQLGICGVDPASEGLVAYWKMDEGEGHIFHDSTGHGYDMDWSQTVRDTNESGNLTATPNAATVVDNGWIEDDHNKCVN